MRKIFEFGSAGAAFGATIGGAIGTLIAETGTVAASVALIASGPIGWIGGAALFTAGTV